MLTSLILFAVIATFSPGGATTLVTASGAQFGFLRSMPLVLGIATALALLVAVTTTGLSSALVRFPVLSLAMRMVGTGYLLWLALKIAKAGPPRSQLGSKAVPIGFVGGALLLLLNPKAWAMAFGVAASFASLSASSAQLSVVMATVFGGSAILSLTAWCAGGAILARLLRTERQWGAFNTTLAALLGLSILQIWL